MIVTGYLLLLVRRREHILGAISLVRVAWLVSGSLEDRKKIVPVWSVALVEVFDIQLVSVPLVAMPSLMVNVIISLTDGHCPLQIVDVTVMPVGRTARPSYGETNRLEGFPEDHPLKKFFKCVCVYMHVCVCVHMHVYGGQIIIFCSYFSLCTVWV